jgi:hypothetical protein
VTHDQAHTTDYGCPCRTCPCHPLATVVAPPSGPRDVCAIGRVCARAGRGRPRQSVVLVGTLGLKRRFYVTWDGSIVFRRTSPGHERPQFRRAFHALTTAYEVRHGGPDTLRLPEGEIHSLRRGLSSVLNQEDRPSITKSLPVDLWNQNRPVPLTVNRPVKETISLRSPVGRDGGRSGSALPRRPDRPSNSQWNELSCHHDGGEGHCHTGKDIRGQRPRGSERRARAHPGSVRQPSGPFPCRQPTQCRPDGVPHVVRVCPLDRRIPSSLCGEEIARTGCVERLVPEPVSQRARTFPITIRFDPVANSSIPQPRPPLARALASLARLH